jgi:thermitase
MPSLPVTGSRLRRAYCLFVSAALLLALLALAVVGVEHSVALDDQAEAVPGELIVGFAPSATEWQEQRAVDKARGELEGRIESVDAAVVTVDPDRTADASARLLRNPAVEFVEPNYVLRARRIPNDRSFSDQW